jgi:hypothetical protein
VWFKLIIFVYGLISLKTIFKLGRVVEVDWDWDSGG